MAEYVEIGDIVEANRELPAKGVKKGDRGKVTSSKGYDSEIYYDILLDDGREVYASCENCWNKVS